MDYCIRTYKDKSQIEHSKSILEESNSAILEQSELLSLAGNPTRLKILVLISHDEELCVCDFSDVLEMSMPAVSQHLKKLREGGMIKSRRQAQTIFYSLNTIGDQFILKLMEQMKLESLSITA
jgi:DNA-binding transcriptional ArsR family regulator